jgi:hypothetical protein
VLVDTLHETVVFELFDIEGARSLCGALRFHLDGRAYVLESDPALLGIVAA